MYQYNDNRRVVNRCVECEPGKYNNEGDDASGPDTSCDIFTCGENEYVSNHTCQACPAGTYNASGDSASDPDTVCDSISGLKSSCRKSQMRTMYFWKI